MLDTPIRVLTVRQPWASLIISGVKDVENRSWPTSHRGLLAIHAATRPDPAGMADHRDLAGAELDYGMVLGTVEVVDCVRRARSVWAMPGQWHWLLANPRPLAQPFHAKGRLGLWEIAEQALASA